MNDGDEQSLGQAIELNSKATVAAPAKDSAPPGRVRTFTRNSLLSVGRLLVSIAVALVLPAYLTHRLSVTTYGAWVLILQLSAYVGYLNFGIETAVAKFVAEYEARGDATGAGKHASAGLALMVASALLGTILTLILAWRVPWLFRQMPASLYRDVQWGILFVGISLSFGLVCTTFASVFLGLQRYAVPMVILTLNRILFTIVVLVAVKFHRSLAIMGCVAALVNVTTGFLQFGAWRLWAAKVRLTLRGLDPAIVKKLLGYCTSLAIFSVGMLLVSGLDVTIVGKYDFSQTAYYSVATLPTALTVALLAAALAPFMPAVSALSVHRTPRELGALLSRVTRYASILLLISALPLLVEGYWILRVWVGAAYALHTVRYLRILLLANVLRSVTLPYTSMLVATDSQKVAIAGAVAEAVVNLAASIYLVRHIGAVGVAYGTLLGSLVCAGFHFVINMRYTFGKIAISRTRLLLTGLLRPAAIALPSLLLLPYWWFSSVPEFGLRPGLVWGLSTLVIDWTAGLNMQERSAIVAVASRRLPFSARYN